MRVLMISKACIVGIYQKKLEEIAKFPDVELAVVVPPSWADSSGEIRLDRAYVDGYQLRVEPIRFNGNFHLYYFPTLAHCFDDFQPDIVHIDEEPYNLSAWQGQWLAQKIGARTLFFSWQNIRRTYPPPFSIGEAWMLRHVDYAIMGTDSAAEVWQAKGYHKPLAVIPQFGIDPDFFHPNPKTHTMFTIGYAGRLVPEKGVDLLIEAVAKLDCQLQVIGQGPERTSLQHLAESLGIANRVIFRDQVVSTQMPDFYHQLDVLVIPSRTRSNWKEQFGRVIVEAMACGVPVIGSDSGAIPGVIGNAGLIFPENNLAALVQLLQKLMSDQALRQKLGQCGRERVLEKFTHAQVAAQTVEIYRKLGQ